ncbi:MAG: nuclear transport factor 2 family protein [Saprospiraceae bacterium]
MTKIKKYKGKPFWNFLLILIPAAFFSCAENYNPLKIKEEATQMLDDYHEAISKESLLGEFAFLDSSEQFFWVPPGYTKALTYEEVALFLRKNSANFSAIDFKWDQLDVYPLSNEIATYTGLLSGSMTDTSGQVSPVKMIESGTLIKRKDGWKLLCGQSRNL